MSLCFTVITLLHTAGHSSLKKGTNFFPRNNEVETITITFFCVCVRAIVSAVDCTHEHCLYYYSLFKYLTDFQIFLNHVNLQKIALNCNYYLNAKMLKIPQTERFTNETLNTLEKIVWKIIQSNRNKTIRHIMLWHENSLKTIMERYGKGYVGYRLNPRWIYNPINSYRKPMGRNESFHNLIIILLLRVLARINHGRNNQINVDSTNGVNFILVLKL